MLPIEIKTSQKGLPGKSYTHILSLDYYLKMALCYICHAPFFNSYISSLVGWKFRFKDRERVVDEFINFLAIGDESRVESVFTGKILHRVHLIKLLIKMDNEITRFKEIKNKESISDEEFLFLFSIQNKYGDMLDIYINYLPPIISHIKKIKDTLTKHYVSFIVKGLMQRRKGETNPNKLKSDAYEILVMMLRQYNPYKSKVPFHNYLKYYIRSGKDKVIKRELWDLQEGSLVYFEDLEKSGKSDEDKDGSVVEEILKSSYSQMRITEEKRELVDKIGSYLPRSFGQILAVNYCLIDPLSPEEEVHLLVS